MGEISFGWLAVWVPSPDWLCCILELCDVCQALRWSRRAWGEGSAGRAPTLYRINWHLPYNWAKSWKTSVRVTEWRSAVQRRTRFVLSTCPCPRPRLASPRLGLPCLAGPGIVSRWGEIFRLSRPALRPTQPPVKMGTRSFTEVKCGRGVLLTTHPLLVPLSWKSRSISLPTLWATPGL